MRHGRTIMTVDLQDQAALHGFLEMLESAGIALVAVNPAGGDAPAASAPA
jgi:hypothetical protein